MTATLTSPTPAVSLPTMPEPYRFSVEQYHRLGEAGILTGDDRVELLDGIVVRKMTKYTPHTTATLLTEAALRAILPPGWHLRNQEPLNLPGSVPEPDLVIVRGSIRDYLIRHPVSADVALVVEVADSSLAVDRGWKMRIYADARLPVYWIVNLIDRVVEVRTDPHGSGDAADYATLHTFAITDAVPLSVGGQPLPPVPVVDVMP